MIINHNLALLRRIHRPKDHSAFFFFDLAGGASASVEKLWVFTSAKSAASPASTAAAWSAVSCRLCSAARPSASLARIAASLAAAASLWTRAWAWTYAWA